MSEAEECRSPIGLDCCSCCLDLANCHDLTEGGASPQSRRGHHGNPLIGSPSPTSVHHFRQFRDQLALPNQNLNADKLSNMMRQDSLESVVRDPCYLLNEGICNSNIDQTTLSILLFFHRPVHLMERMIHINAELCYDSDSEVLLEDPTIEAQHTH